MTAPAAQSSPDPAPRCNAAPPPPDEPSEAAYWDYTATEYQQRTRISCTRLHLGPLLPDAETLDLVPLDLRGLHCLELGCGGAQNSIALARRGARCTAIDASRHQLDHACRLAGSHDIDLQLLQADLEHPLPLPDARFDFVHSVFALPFLRNPQLLIQEAARVIRTDATFLLSAAHPLAFAEWLDVDGECGMFLTDWNSPPSDSRRVYDRGRHLESRSRAWPVSQLHAWLTQAGFHVERLLEPVAALDTGGTGDNASECPYWSPAWQERAPQLRRFPFAVVFLCRKTETADDPE